MNVNLFGLQATLLILSILLGRSLLSDARDLDPDESPEESIANSLSIMKKLRSTREGLGSLQQVLHDIDEDLRRQHELQVGREKRSTWYRLCQAGIVRPGYLCHIPGDNTYTNFSQTSLNPGKRGGWPDTLVSQSYYSKYVLMFGSSLGDISRKRNGLEILKRILSEMDSDLMSQQKRTCKLNLGGHCATESAAAAADQWSFLQSPFSPGRRRRDTSLFLSKLTAPKSEQ